MAPTYVRTVQLGAYMWRKGLSGLISFVCAPHAVQDHFWKIFFRCLAGFCDGSPPATSRRGGYSETPAGGQPGPTRAAPPAAFGVAARGGGSCGGCGSGGRPQRGANQPDDAADSGQVRACDMRATCLHSVLRSVLRSVREGKGQGREGEAGQA